ncbi:MAG: hypothetical protein ABJH06_09295 [Paraglaciecola sp.]|uniref:hypothetical protein n=1 Tax=Paraglaciecola sp. TaxID=1920173 RepID=UPI00329A1597
MLKYILKWLAASLVVPFLTLALASFVDYTIFLQDVTLVFWPSSIFLMSLGGQHHALTDVIFVWSVAIGCNIVLYGVIGCLLYCFCLRFKKNENAEL